MTKGIIRFGTKTIPYLLRFTERKTLGITVTPEGEVEVSAPIGASLEQIEERLLKRAGWIVKQQLYFRSFGERSPQKEYISGESHYYLGRQYLLRVTEGKPQGAKYKGGCFEVVCSPRSKAGELMREWYRERAKLKFAEIAGPITARFSKYGVKPSSIQVQEMENRWGSCTSGGKIILNTALIKAPKPCIEYVITHELCHLVHRGHTKAFFALLETEMPDWKRWKEKLERFMY
ncbi:MAG: M48 family metallopeptidase [Bacteroidales bacterium]